MVRLPMRASLVSRATNRSICSDGGSASNFRGHATGGVADGARSQDVCGMLRHISLKHTGRVRQGKVRAASERGSRSGHHDRAAQVRRRSSCGISASIGRETFRGSTRLENSPLCLALDRACPGSQSPSKVVSRDLPAAQAGKFPPVLFVLRWALENRRISRTDGMDPARLYTASGWAKDVLSNIRTKRGGSGMEITTIGIDLAKSVFAVSGADSSGRVVMRRQLRRAQVLNFMRGLPRCVVGMEAWS